MEKNKLITQLKASNKHTFNQLYTEYSGRLYRFIYGYMKSDEDARDMIQEVFIKLWNSRMNMKIDTNIEALLFTITKNVIISTFRKKINEKKYLEHLKHVVVKNHLNTEQQVDYALLSEKVGKLIEGLPKQRQKIYCLSKNKGYTNKAIAKELQISIKTVEDHMTKARKFLKENLKEYGFLAILFYKMFIS